MTNPRPTPPTRAEIAGAMVAGARAARDGAGVAACPWSIRDEHPRARLLARAWVGAYAHEAPEPSDDPAAARDEDADGQEPV